MVVFNNVNNINKSPIYLIYNLNKILSFYPFIIISVYQYIYNKVNICLYIKKKYSLIIS